MDWIVAHWKDIAELIAAIIGVASIVVKITPTLKDNDALLPIIKFIGRWVALDKYSPTNRPNA